MNLSTDLSERQRVARDASIFEVVPEAVAKPKSEQELADLVHYARQKGTSLTPRNGGTCMSGGPLSEGIVVDMAALNSVEEVDEHGLLWVHGGTMQTQVEAVAHPKGWFFAPYTSSRDICGIGGMIGNNASGEQSVRYGATSRNVARLRVLLSDGNTYEFGPLSRSEVARKCGQQDFEGEIYRRMVALVREHADLIHHSYPRVPKNAAGYALNELWDEQHGIFNLARLFVGAQGTLGIVTQAQLKLTPMVGASRMVVVPITGLSELTPTVQTMLSFKPQTCETFDHHTYELAEQYHPEDAARASLAKGKHLVVFAIYAGKDQAQADRQAARAKAALEAQGREVLWIDDHAVQESFLLIRRKSFRMLLEHPHPSKRAMAFLEDTIVPLAHYGPYLAALEEILAEYDMTYTYAGHIGDGSIRLVPLVDMDDPTAPDRVMELERRVNDLVFAFGGSMSVDHGDGIIRTPFLERMFGPEMVTLFAEVKAIFDPHNLFNPGKKVGGTLSYALEHIRRGNQ